MNHLIPNVIRVSYKTFSFDITGETFINCQKYFSEEDLDMHGNLQIKSYEEYVNLSTSYANYVNNLVRGNHVR